MHLPLVSVVSPCFNQAKYLPFTLDSVLGQNYKNWECIIVNDGSTDNTEDVALAYQRRDDRFRYLKKQNGGLSSARNTGIEHSNADFIQLLDSDDLICVDKLSSQIAFLMENQSVDIAYSGSRYFRTDFPDNLLLLGGGGRHLGTVEISMYDRDVLRLILSRNPFVVSAPLYRMYLFRKIGLFDFALKALEDWDFHLRCAINECTFHYLGYTPDTSTLIRLHEENMTWDRDRMKSSRNAVIRKHLAMDVDHILAEQLSEVTCLRRTMYLITPPAIEIAIKKLLSLLKISDGRSK
jgi:glycosyltransferase involved in cell wall biosynthesis